MWTLDIGVPVSDQYDVLEVSHQLLEEVLGERVGSLEGAGCGFGFRDMQFTFDLWTEGIQAWERAHNFFDQLGSGNIYEEAYAELYSWPSLP